MLYCTGKEGSKEPRKAALIFIYMFFQTQLCRMCCTNKLQFVCGDSLDQETHSLYSPCGWKVQLRHPTLSPVKVEVVHPLIMATFVKLPPPRQLTQNESLDSLDHWKSIFRSYFRRDSIFRQFLDTTAVWYPNRENYGLVEANDMTPQERCDALKDFLNTLAGFLPHSYLTSKLLNTRKLEDCWDIIEEHYNVKVTPETFLDFENIKKNPEENYRQFYERLLQHSKLHAHP